MNPSLIAIMRYAKSSKPPMGWREVAVELAKIYYPDMSLTDTVSLLVGLYGEALSEPRFEMSLSTDCRAATAMLLAPIKGHFAVESLGPTSLDAAYTVEQFYDAIVKQIISELRLSRVDWCKEYFAAEGSQPALVTA